MPLRTILVEKENASERMYDLLQSTTMSSSLNYIWLSILRVFITE